MQKDNFKKIDLYSLPPRIIQELDQRFQKILLGLKEIKWPIKAIVLGGGYKHKELTYNQSDIGSDIDLFVFSNFIPFFWKKLVRIQNNLNKKRFFFHYRGGIPFFLPKSKTFWAYKLKNEGIILKGDKNILEKIRANESNIPKIEAIRILFQTLVVWNLLVKTESGKFKREVGAFTILRNYLNIGESYLTFGGYLRPSYQKRMNEFKKRSPEFNLDKETRRKIILGYLTKVNPNQAKVESQNYQLSLLQANKDCLKTINYLLSLLCPGPGNLNKKLDILAERIKPKLFFNFIFYLFLRKIETIKPKFFPIIFKFKITDLWKIAFYHEVGQLKERNKLLNEYFYFENFSDEVLIKIYELYPIHVLMEI